MNGSVRKKGDQWYFSFELAKVGGKRRRVERAGGRTKKEAQAKMREVMAEYEKAGQLFDESEISVSDYMDYWIDNYVRTNLKYNSLTYYQGIIKNHIKPKFGHYKLSTITPATIQTFINGKFIEGYSKNSLTNMMGLLSKAFKMAVHPYGFIKQDPTRFVTVPKMDQKPKDGEDLKIIAMKDYRKILERFPRGSTFYVPLEIAFGTGMRGGEVCALTWDNVNLSAKTIRVEKTMIMMEHGHWELGTPKTKNSYRTVQITEHLATVLKQAQRDQKENSLKYGQYYLQSNHVCTKENGEPVTTNSLKYLSRVVNYELMINFNFHSLRHTHASILVASGANFKAIQERLGHSNLSTTMDTYAHISEDLKASTADLLERLSKIVD